MRVPRVCRAARQLSGSSGVVTLSQTTRNLPTTANVDAMDFKDLACWLIVQIGPISLNVTTPPGGYKKTKGAPAEAADSAKFLPCPANAFNSMMTWRVWKPS